MKYLLPILVLGCQSTQEGGLSLPFAKAIAESPSTEVAHALDPLKFSGTILILTGGGLLFVTRGNRGWIPVALGIALTVVMAVLAKVLESQIFVFTLIAGLCVTAGVAALNFKEIRTWIKLFPSSPSLRGTLLPSPSEHGSGDRSLNS
jgi:hypothetical protein|tara:strand:- start:1151 stop:1594 length:444 start_codon:yes stop_codon:yes gene_type:complete